MLHFKNAFINPYTLRGKGKASIGGALAAIYSVSILSSVYYLPFSASAFITAFAVQRLSKFNGRKRDKFVISDTMEMIKSMSEAKAMTRYSAVLSSIPKDFKHYLQIKNSMEKFRLTGDVDDSFGAMIKSGDKQLRDIGAILYSSFVTGSNTSSASSWFIKKNSATMKYGLKLLPMAENSELMLISGINFFFPLFAGITLNIIRFSSPGAYTSSYIPLLGLFIFYILSVNYVTLKNSFIARGKYIIRVLELSAFASLVVQIALHASYLML
jgi:hypothetical protein